jgi:hypothetical protein
MTTVGTTTPQQRSVRARIGGVVMAVLLAVGLVGVAGVSAAPANASVTESDLRSTVHARLAVFVDDAVSSGYYTENQRSYILSVISTTAPDSLSDRQTRQVMGRFWRIITEVGGISRNLAERRLGNGATLTRVVGSDADAVRDRLRSWLSAPVVNAIGRGDVSWSEAAGLLADTRTAVNRLMAQPGGDRDVILVRKRN